jgi:hypothetical protein
MFRQGLRELRGALYPESNIAQPTDYGIAGVATPGEVAEARRENTRDFDEEHKQGPEPPRDQRVREGPEPEME